MKKILVFIFALGLTISAQAFMAPVCQKGNPLHVRVLAESGCPSGLVIMSIETACVEANSPVFSSLRPNKNYDTCLEGTKPSFVIVWSAIESNVF